MSHGYNPAGNSSGGQWQAGYQQQGQAAQSAQPQSYAGQSQQQFGGAQYAGPQSYAGQPQGNPQQYAGQQYPPPQASQQYAQPQKFAGQVQGGGQQYAAPQSAPSQQVQASAQLAKDPRADDWIRLKGRANVAILNSALRFFGFPFLSLLIGIAKAHDVYDAAKQLGAPSDVLLRARIAMGTAALLIFVQLAILVVVVIGANM